MHQFNEHERMTPQEAEEVLRRFREEEELRQREMEAQATNPTVSDLAEGLGVTEDRIAALLARVRSDAVPPKFSAEPISVSHAQEQVKRANRVAWFIAGLVAVVFVVLLVLGIVFSMPPSPPDPVAPVPVVAPEPSGAGGGDDVVSPETI